MRTSNSQFQLLVEFMERHGDLSKPTEGPHGRATNIKNWNDLVKMLNEDETGDTRLLEKWRKVWSDFKNNTKRKAAKIFRATQGTGGGPASQLKLTDLEERVLSIIGMQAATGINTIPEVGLEEEATEQPPDPGTNDSSPYLIFPIPEVNQETQETCSYIEDTNAEPPQFRFPSEASSGPAFALEEWDRPSTSAQRPRFPPLRQGAGGTRRPPISLLPASPGSEAERSGCGVSSDARMPAPSPASISEAGRSGSRVSSAVRMPPPTPATFSEAGQSGGGVSAAARMSAPSPAPDTRNHAPQRPTPLPLTPRWRQRRGRQPTSPILRRTRAQTQSDLARQAFVKSDCEWRNFQQDVERERNRLRQEEIRVQQRWLQLYEQFLLLGNRIVNIIERKWN